MKKFYNYILPAVFALFVASCDDQEGETVQMLNHDPIVTVEDISPAKVMWATNLLLRALTLVWCPEI